MVDWRRRISWLRWLEAISCTKPFRDGRSPGGKKRRGESLMTCPQDSRHTATRLLMFSNISYVQPFETGTTQVVWRQSDIWGAEPTVAQSRIRRQKRNSVPSTRRYNRLFMGYFCNGDLRKSSNKWGEIWKSSRAAGAGRSRERGKIP
jgi:hypothetical protein